MKILAKLFLLSALISAAGCSLWSEDSSIKPAELVEFQEEKKVDLLWKLDLGVAGNNKWSQMLPAVYEGSVFAASTSGKIIAVDATSGREQWSVETNNRWTAGVSAGYGRILVADENGIIQARSSQNGDLLWQADIIAEVSATPEMNSEIVVIQRVDGQLTALNATTGAYLWTFDSQAPRLTLRGTSSPIVTADATFAAFANGKVVALRNDNGKVVWDLRVAVPEGRTELERMVDLDGKPLLFENALYVSSYQGQLASLNPYNAQINWAKKLSSYRSLAVGFGNVYIVNADDEIQAYDLNTSASVWSQPALGHRLLTAPATQSSHLVVGDSEGYIHVVSQIDGHFMARLALSDSAFTGDIVAAEGVFYLMSNSGELFAITIN